MGKKVYHVDLTDTERIRLYDIAKRRKSESEATKRSLILLACDRNGDKVWTDIEIATEYKRHYVPLMLEIKCRDFWSD